MRAVVPGGSVQGSGIRRRCRSLSNRVTRRRAQSMSPRNGGTIGTLGGQRSSQHRWFFVQYTAERLASLRPVPGEFDTGIGEDGILHANVATLRPALPRLRVAEALLPAINFIPIETSTTIITLQQYYRQWVSILIIEIQYPLVSSFQIVNFSNCFLSGLLDHYPKDHTDFEDCLAARDRLGETLLEGLTVINQAVRKL